MTRRTGWLSTSNNWHLATGLRARRKRRNAWISLVIWCVGMLTLMACGVLAWLI